MGALSDQFLHLLWRPPYVFFFILYEALRSFLYILYWGPQITFFAYYMGLFRSLFSHTIWRGGGHLRFYFFHKIYGGLLRSVSPLTIWGSLRLVSVLTIWGPLRSVSVHTFWGPLSDKFFVLLDGAPSSQFLCLL